MTKMLEHVEFFSAGGSIDKTYSAVTSSFEVAEPMVEEILEQSGVRFTYSVKSLLKKDSLSMDDRDRGRIREAVLKSNAKRIVITHGTDTMIETGRVLRGIPGKTIVLTGAFMPARLKDSDGVFNIGMAVAAVQVLRPGVFIAMNGQISPVEQIEKDPAKKVFRPRLQPLPERSGPRSAAPGTTTDQPQSLDSRPGHPRSVRGEH